MKHEHNEFGNLLDILKNLPPPPKKEGYEGMLVRDHQKIPCACNEKIISINECRRIDTGVVQALDTMCKDCKQAVKGTCPLICIRCKRVASRMEPGKDKKTGFVFKAGRPYHLDGCPFCEEGVQKSIIIEKLMYEKERNK